MLSFIEALVKTSISLPRQPNDGNAVHYSNICCDKARVCHRIMTRMQLLAHASLPCLLSL